jgi:hypothetical protein
MVHPGFWKDRTSSDEKETVMVDIFLAKVKMEETVYILISRCIRQNVGWHKVEIRSVEFDILVKLFGDVAEMAQFVHQGRAVGKSLEFA